MNHPKPTAPAFPSLQGLGTASADIVYLPSSVVTFDPDRPEAQAVAVKSGTIVAAVTIAEVQVWIGPHTQVLDLGPAAILPGLTDSHVHPIWGITGIA